MEPRLATSSESVAAAGGHQPSFVAQNTSILDEGRLADKRVEGGAGKLRGAFIIWPKTGYNAITRSPDPNV